MRAPIPARFEIKISDATAERALGRTNIAPTQSVLAVVNGENGAREAILAVPARARVAKLGGGPSLINTAPTSSRPPALGNRS